MAGGQEVLESEHDPGQRSLEDRSDARRGTGHHEHLGVIGTEASCESPLGECSDRTADQDGGALKPECSSGFPANTRPRSPSGTGARTPSAPREDQPYRRSDRNNRDRSPNDHVEQSFTRHFLDRRNGQTGRHTNKDGQ